MITSENNFSIFVFIDKPKHEITDEIEFEAWEKAGNYAEEHGMEGSVVFDRVEQESKTTSKLIFYMD